MWKSFYFVQTYLSFCSCDCALSTLSLIFQLPPLPAGRGFDARIPLDISRAVGQLHKMAKPKPCCQRVFAIIRRLIHHSETGSL